MTRPKNQFVRAFLISALVVIGAGTTLASADGGYGHGRHSDRHRYERSIYAGKIVIDGYATRIRTDRPMLRQIARAFRRAGYSARIEYGQVRIDFGYCRPGVQWSTDRYRARLNWDHDYDSLSISLNRYGEYQRGHRHARYPVRVARRSLRWRDDD